ncbi:recombinase family protein [Gemella morbillorum]
MRVCLIVSVGLLFSKQESGKDTNRPVLNEMLNSIRANDKAIISSLDKLSRNHKDLKEIIQIIKDKGQEYFFVTLKIFLANPLLFLFFAILLLCESIRKE